jgi:hypothetical protein
MRAQTDSSHGQQPSLPLRETQNQRSRSALRCCNIEDKLVRLFAHHGQPLTELVAFTAHALEQMDSAFAALPSDADPWIWPIFQSERRLVGALRANYPANPEVMKRVADASNEMSTEATVDEIANGAIKALKWAAT